MSDLRLRAFIDTDLPSRSFVREAEPSCKRCKRQLSAILDERALTVSPA